MALLLAIGIPVALYAAAVATLYFNQRAMLYFPQASRMEGPTPAAAGLDGFDAVVIPTADGERLNGWWRAPRQGQGAVIYFYGNAGSLAGRANRLRDLSQQGLGVLALDYRGYGRSSGKPSETGLRRDGAAAFDFVRRAVPEAKVALFGESLGAAVAIAVAEERPVGGLVLDSPFSSALRLAQHQYPWVPSAWLMKDRWDSQARLSRLGVPVLIGHCQEDTVIPIGEAQRLDVAARQRSRLLVLRGCAHASAWEAGLREAGLPSLVAWTRSAADGAQPQP